MNRYFFFTCLSSAGLLGQTVWLIGLTFIIMLFCRFSRSLLHSLGRGVLKMMEVVVLGLGLVGRATWFGRPGCLVCQADQVIAFLRVHVHD